MAKKNIKETIKETHKLTIEGDFIIEDNNIFVVVDDDVEDRKPLSELAVNFNGKYLKLVFTEDTEREIEPNENIDED